MQRNFFEFIKNNSQFIYSLILIIFIPVAIVINTLVNIDSTQKNMDSELRKKAVLAESIFAASVADSLANDQAIQQKIDQITKTNLELKEVTVMKPETDGFRVVASSDAKNISLLIKSEENTIAWINEKSTATLISDPNETPAERYWAVASLLRDTAGAKIAVVDLKVSLEDIDALTRKSLSTSLIYLVVTIFIVLLLLVNHFRFFEYAILFRRLKEVDKMKDDFISIASHELKTPMAAIKGYLSMIFEGVAGSIDQKAKGHLEKVYANVKRLDILVNELLDVSRLEQQRIQFDMQPVDISQIIKQIIGELKVKADEKKLYIKYQEPAEPKPVIFADPERIGQVLDNVIGNAIKYTPKGGIEIFHKIESDKLQTMIKDTGIGMAPEDRKRLFEQFYRIQNEKTMDIPGTGLGLWITRELVHRMNGEIYADSMEGVGSQFTIVFSIIKEKKWEKWPGYYSWVILVFLSSWE